MNQIIRQIEAPLMKEKLPVLHIGDTVKVFVKIIEGGKERTQGYEGVIIKRAGSGINETITVRRVFQGIGIERVFLLHSPRVEKITVQRRGDVRRAKLYYLRQRTGKATRIKEKMGAARQSLTAMRAAVAPELLERGGQASAEPELEEALEPPVSEQMEAPVGEAPAADAAETPEATAAESVEAPSAEQTEESSQ